MVFERVGTIGKSSLKTFCLWVFISGKSGLSGSSELSSNSVESATQVCRLQASSKFSVSTKSVFFSTLGYKIKISKLKHSFGNLLVFLSSSPILYPYQLQKHWRGGMFSVLCTAINLRFADGIKTKIKIHP